MHIQGGWTLKCMSRGRSGCQDRSICEEHQSNTASAQRSTAAGREGAVETEEAVHRANAASSISTLAFSRWMWRLFLATEKQNTRSDQA